MIVLRKGAWFNYQLGGFLSSDKFIIYCSKTPAMHFAKFEFERLFVEMWCSRESRPNTQEDEDTLRSFLHHAINQ